MSLESRDYRVGLFASVGLLVLFLLILLYGEEPSWIMTTRYDLEIHVDNPSGIGEGTPAFMQGVQVGRVSEIKFRDPLLPSAGAAVIVGIDDEYPIPQGSTATIHPSFGFDKGAINIDPPTEKSEPVAAGGYILGTMKGALESIVPEEYIHDLGQAVDEISNMVDKIAVVSEDLHELLQVRTTEAVDDPSQDVSANLYTAIQRADESLKLFNQMMGEGGDLRAVAGNLRAWTEKLEPRTEALVAQADQTMRSIRDRTEELGEKMVEAVGTLSGVLDQVHKSMVAINEGDGALGKVIHDPKLYQELLDSFDLLQALMEDMRRLMVWVENESLLKLGL